MLSYLPARIDNMEAMYGIGKFADMLVVFCVKDGAAR